MTLAWTLFGALLLVNLTIGDEVAERKAKLLKTIESHESWKYLETDDDVVCGAGGADRIIGGVNAALGQYPWLARLGYKDTEDKTPGRVAYKCGGSVINKKYILTAAHCVTPLVPFTVRLGEYDVRTEVDCSNSECADKPQDFDIEEITTHESYNNPKLTNDIALIKLKGKANFTTWVSPICLPKSDTKLDYSTKADVAGWGTTDMDTLEVADVLQTVSVPLVDLVKCGVFYKRVSPIIEKQVCAGGIIDKDACGGDSGGPLMQVIMGAEEPQYYQMGIVSFGPKMCGGKPPGVFTDVPSYMGWILDHVKEK